MDILRIAKVLIKNKANINATDREGRSLVHEACNLVSEKFLKLLIENKANVDIPDHNGNTGFIVLFFMITGVIKKRRNNYKYDKNIIRK